MRPLLLATTLLASLPLLAADDAELALAFGDAQLKPLRGGETLDWRLVTA